MESIKTYLDFSPFLSYFYLKSHIYLERYFNPCFGRTNKRENIFQTKRNENLSILGYTVNVFEKCLPKI